MLSIGIDFGTSNSSVAVYDPSAPLRAGAPDVKLLELDAHAKDRRVMRSLLYIPRDGEIVAGQRALDLYTEQNTGREVKMERRYLGEVKMTFSDMEVVKDAYAMVDVNEPGRLFQSLKRFLVMTSFTKTDVFGTEYSLEELVATLAEQMVRAAEAALGSRISSLVVGRPVRFDDDDEKDRGALARLKEAWGRVGLDEVSYMEEPVAAAHHHASEARLVEGTRFLVFDFGGGTLDIPAAEPVGESLQVLARRGASRAGARPGRGAAVGTGGWGAGVWRRASARVSGRRWPAIAPTSASITATWSSPSPCTRGNSVPGSGSPRPAFRSPRFGPTPTPRRNRRTARRPRSWLCPAH